MHNVFKILILFFFGLANGCSFAGQEGSISDGFYYPESPVMIEYENIWVASCLCGVAKNPANDELEDVLIELINESTNQRITAVLSTSDGQFNLNHIEKGKGPFLLKFSKFGFNTVLLRVFLDKDSPQKLTITLPFN